MATETRTYPKISRKSWFLVRDRLKKSIPTAITPTLITSLSHMEDASARSNVINPLRELKLVDEENKPTALAERWRHDDDYAQVCTEIRENTYPKDLIEAFPAPDVSNKEAIKRWFMKAGQVGEKAAGMYTDTYLLLSEGNPNPRETASVTAPSRKRADAPRPIKTRPAEKGDLPKASNPIEEPPLHKKRMPSIHIDVQVHISPETSPEQIDHIFESMAKHLGTYVQ